MFNNYLYLLRGIEELREIIIDKVIVDIYTQEKDKLFLKIPLKHNPDFTLVLSTQTQASYFSIKSEHKKARKNTREFFEEYLPAKIEDILIVKNDRTIKFVLTTRAIYFLIRGSKSNVFFVNNSSFFQFKKIEANYREIIFSEIHNAQFISPQDSFISIINDAKSLDRDELFNKYRFLDKSIINKLPEDSWRNRIIELINDVMKDIIWINILPNNSDINFLPQLTNENPVGQSYFYRSYFDAVNKFISLKHVIKRDVSTKKELEKYIDREIEKISNKLNDIKAKIEKGSREIEYSDTASTLLSNINKIKKGMDSIKLHDQVNNMAITISLDKTLSPSQNIDQYFAKSKSEKVSFQKAKTLFADLDSKYKKYMVIRQRINNSDNYDEISSLKKELGIKSKMEIQNQNHESNYRHFIIDNKYHVFVGKNSKNNDELTTRFAKQNDLWFHARSVSGSHVVLRIDNTKEPVPKNIIKKAASIAAFYSKAKTSKLVSVSYTFKKYVTKRKDLEPGKVILLREQVILVPPEIPHGCLTLE